MGFSVHNLTRESEAAAGFAVYVFILTAAYYYNLTLVQLGLTEVGVERVGLSMESVAVAMGLLAITTLAVTLVSGYLVDRFGWGTALRLKFRVLFGVLLLQIGITVLLGAVSSFLGFLAWVLACAVLLGAAIPFAFSLMLDLVSPGLRGYAAGAVAGCSFFLASLLPFEWTVGRFVPAAVVVLLPVVLLLGVLSVAPTTAGGGTGPQRSESNGDLSGRLRVLRAPVVVGLVLLFGAFFLDSLGFVRIIETPAYVDDSWQSPDYSTRLLIGVTHIVGGLAAGVVYTKLRHLWLFGATFALFALAQCLYVYDIVAGGPSLLGIATPLVYVVAVSCYTTVTFALWPELATPETVGTVTAVGVGVGGWMATFASTALALVSDRLQVDIAVHLLAVGALSVVFLLLTLSMLSLSAETGGRDYRSSDR